MSKQLYEEALADVKKLKEVAEDNAKRALLEAVTPRIRDLIENQLLGELEDTKKVSDEEDELLLDDPVMGSKSPRDKDAGSDVEEVASDSKKDDESDDDKAKSVEENVYELSVESARALGLLIKESDAGFEGKLGSVAQRIKELTNASRIVKESKGFGDVVSSLINEVEDMYVHVQEKMESSKKKNSYESILENYYSTLKQLTERKMKRNRSLSEVTLKLDLELPGLEDLDDEALKDAAVTIAPAGEEEAEEEGELEAEEGEGEELFGDEDEESDEESGEEEEGDKMESRELSDNTIVEIDEGMLRREISRMKALREAKDDVQAWGHGAGEVSDEFVDEDMGDPFVDVELTTEGEAHGMDEGDDVLEIVDESEDEKPVDEYSMAKEVDEMAEADVVDEMDMVDEMEEAEDTKEYGGVRDEAQTNKQSRQPGPTVESIKRRLAAEASLQAEAKKRAQTAKKKRAATVAQLKKEQAKGKQGKQDKKGNTQTEALLKIAQQLQETYTRHAKRFNESVRRTQQLKGMLNEAVRKGSALNGAPTRSAGETTDLRNKLAETNLFNTKLLFANKVLQNESFTRSQKAGIIERLDEARSEREVKLVYESLVKTLDNTTRRQVNESRERAVMGSSSRPTKPSSTLNEGFETDRWARLAGIVK